MFHSCRDHFSKDDKLILNFSNLQDTINICFIHILR